MDFFLGGLEMEKVRGEGMCDFDCVSFGRGKA